MKSPLKMVLSAAVIFALSISLILLVIQHLSEIQSFCDRFLNRNKKEFLFDDLSDFDLDEEDFEAVM